MDQNQDKWAHCLEHATLSDVGLRRANNQDATAVMTAGSQQTYQQRGHLFMVADGMGAHAAGELASKMAVESVPLTYHKLRGLSPPDTLREAFLAANQQIYNRGQASDDFRGMGTTATTLVLLPAGAIVAHVGDSRAYRLRGERFDQLTFDHSLVWEMTASARSSEKHLSEHLPKNIITRSLGPNPEVQVDLEGPFPLKIGDVFLLCTDGLSGQVEDEEIGAILQCLPANEAVRALVDLANARGGPDNITVIVARVTGSQVVAEVDAPSAGSQRRPTRAIHPMLWSLLGVFILATAGAIGVGRWDVALAGLLAILLATAVLLVRRYGDSQSDYEPAEQPLGKGPHAGFDCTPDNRFATRLAGVVQELCNAAAKEDWTLDFDRLNTLRSQATAAVEANDHAQAVRQYCRALSFIMAQLRRQHPNDDTTTYL